MTDEARLEEMIAAACLRADSEVAFTADLRGFLDSFGLAAADVQAILEAAPRLALYRRLVRNNLTGVTEKMLQRARARLNDLSAGAFDASFAAWLDEVGPKTHYLRDVPAAFLDWAAPRWGARSEVPAWLPDLARHELVQYQVSAAPHSAEPPALTDAAPDRPLVFADGVRLVRYSFAVHELPASIDDRSAPSPRATALLVYRDAEYAVQTLELTPFAAAITERLLAGAPLLDAVRDAAAAVNATTGVDDVARFLSDLGARGVLLGGRA